MTKLGLGLSMGGGCAESEVTGPRRRYIVWRYTSVATTNRSESELHLILSRAKYDMQRFRKEVMMWKTLHDPNVLLSTG